MFSYVAKSLLSKTLQTFLSNYLENIELESIEYGASSSGGSASSGNGGGGKKAPAGGGGGGSAAATSGWGVRLSNVKLREGMELVKLPGKRKRVVTRKRRAKRSGGRGRTKGASAVDVDVTPVTKNTKRIIGDESSSVVGKLALDDGNGAAVAAQGENDAGASSSSSVVEGEKKGGVLINPVVEISSLPLHNRDRLPSVDTDNGYFSSNPSTPNQSTNGLCGVPSAFCRNSNAAAKARKEAVANVHLPFSDEDQLKDMQSAQLLQPKPKKGEWRAAKDPKSGLVYYYHTATKESTWTEPADYVAKPGAHSGKSRPGASEEKTESNNIKAKPSVAKPSEPVAADKHCDDVDDDDSLTDVEEEVTVEDDLALVVGAGGAIGTLNIRLVGKELHVTVEDAHLIVEAVPLESVADGDGDGANAPQPPKPNLDRSSSSSSEADSPNAADEKESTIGEKIKKKSVLARYLSMIPHLFLRDCRVSLILPPEDAGDDDSIGDSCDDCTVFEMGIDFLSVTSGDDFLDTLRFDTGNQAAEGKPTPKSQPFGFRRSSSVGSETPTSNSEGKRIAKNRLSSQHNVFARKRIRTGKGPEGGIWLKIHPPFGRTPLHARQPNEPKWARRRFLDSSESFFVRCSGIDMQARMLVENKKEDEVEEIGSIWSNEYEDYTMDSMLFGVDYVDPVSLTRHQIKEKLKREPVPDDKLDVASDTDSNGIQSIPFPSSFHWIAQRSHCSGCTNSHLPLNDCFQCWNACVQQHQSSSPMSELMPLPGFVFSLSMADPLEVNVDRCSLEALGYMKSLMVPSKKPPADIEEGVVTVTTADATDNEARSNTKSWEFGDKSFPPFMQPDAIYLSGLHVSKLIVRVEALKAGVGSGRKFRFWQIVGQSIHFEESQVDAEEHYLRDVTAHIGRLEANEFAGACESHLIVAGSCLGGVSTESCSSGVPQLPCTASRVLGVFHPMATEKHGDAAHIRLIRSSIPKDAATKELASTSSVGYLNMRVGRIDVNLENSLLGDMSEASNVASAIVLRKPKQQQDEKGSNKKRPNPKPAAAVRWLYQVSTVGGTLSYQPRIKMKIPEGEFLMRRGIEGLSFETLLRQLQIEYGKYRFDQPTTPSILPLCSLPESLRMHILLHLDDLTSLEQVLYIKKKKKTSAFLRSHAVNKQLSKLGASIREKKKNLSSENERRSNALSRLQSLDTDSLEALLAMHDRSQSKTK